ncbi:Uma2 family endonuclease [Pseudonocardia nigra]|uniref:Uma2 family endonuclease n=1 Tax=Pseudonocardia nigra TaxID=1921578 RepID=UPI001C5D535E|nr:Uma2 family endonuclease [Pseudonocardia nigra]
MTVSWPNHLLTLEEWEALPEDSAIRLEIGEGVLVMSPRPVFRHQRAGMRLGYRFDEQLPSELAAVTEVEVVIAEAPLTIRVPDVIVTRADLFDDDPARCSAADVLLAVEILSDGSRKIDRVLKFAEYAEAGIPHYWIVDLDEPATLLAHVLVDEAYELSGEHTGRATLEVAGHLVAVDLDALTRR